ncbi:MAG: hypothetical protein NTV73_02790 [Hyphomicrobiales bacterium]|nr:hypothetical protein [Hyphomicrobiales bacterium]
MRLVSLSILLAAWLCGAAAADPPALSVARMSPSSSFVLARDGTIYMEIAYRSDQPIRLQARAFASGVSVDKGQKMNASVVHPASNGRALVWVSFGEPAVIDEIRVTAYDETWRPLQTLAVPRPAQWLAKSAETSVEPPGWVHTLIDAERKIAEQYREDNPPESDPWGSALVAFMFLAVPGYFILQVIALLTQRGRWRWAAVAPFLIMAPAAVHAGLALNAGSNLWPIVLIFAAPLGFLYLAILLALRSARDGRLFA